MHLNVFKSLQTPTSLPKQQNNIKLVDETFLVGKKYIYNPHVEQSTIYNSSIIDSCCDNDEYLIIESEQLLKSNKMSEIHILKEINYAYVDLLTEFMSGTLLGQLNLINFPKNKHFIHNVDSDTNELEIDVSLFDTKSYSFHYF